MEVININEIPVDNALLKRNLFSKKLAKGIKSNANRKAKNSGAKMGCPIFMR